MKQWICIPVHLFSPQRDIDKVQVSFRPHPLYDFLQDVTLRLVARVTFRNWRNTASDREEEFYTNMRRIFG